MHISSASLLLYIAGAATSAVLRPRSTDTQYIAGQYPGWNDAGGREKPYPGDIQGVTLPTASWRDPAPDDSLFQILLAAEWSVSAFYSVAVDTFTPESFSSLGFPNTTWDRIREIRNNELGHAELLRQRISDAVVKPGPCKYNHNFSGPVDFLIRQAGLEAGGPAFLPGLIGITASRENQEFLTAFAQEEVRHQEWSLMEIFKGNPFVGPVDTIYPWPLQILGGIALSIVPGSCPENQPPFLAPLPPMQYNTSTSQGFPGQDIEFIFPVPQLQPMFEEGKEYYVVYFHALSNVTLPFDPKTRMSKVPSVFDMKGVIAAVISDAPGERMSEQSTVSAPLLLIQQPDFSVLAGLLR